MEREKTDVTNCTTMLYLYIYIALFAGTLILAVWNSHNKVKHHSKQEGYPLFLGIKTQDPAWLLLLLSGLTAPLTVPLLIAGGINRLYCRIRYHNRPKSVPKNLRRYLYADAVFCRDTCRRQEVAQRALSQDEALGVFGHTVSSRFNCYKIR